MKQANYTIILILLLLTTLTVSSQTVSGTDAIFQKSEEAKETSGGSENFFNPHKAATPSTPTRSEAPIRYRGFNSTSSETSVVSFNRNMEPSSYSLSSLSGFSLAGESTPPIQRAGGNEGGGDPSKLPIGNAISVLLLLSAGYILFRMKKMKAMK